MRERKCGCALSGGALLMDQCDLHKMRLFYLRSEPVPPAKRGAPLACVAYRVAENGMVIYAVSAWNPKFPLSKNLCREVAVGRLKTGKLAGQVADGPEAKRQAIFTLVDGHVAEGHNPSPTLAKVAMYWLENNPPGRVEKGA